MPHRVPALPPLLLACALLAPAARAADDNAWDFRPQPLARIPAGTDVTGPRVEGWSHPVLFVTGRLSAGDLDSVSGTVQKYSELFNLVLLANIATDPQGAHYLDRVGIGFSTKIGGRDVVVTSDSHKRLGAGLGLIGGTLLSANEAALKDTQQTARYRYGAVVDAPTLMAVNGEHHMRMARYFLWVSKSTGKLGSLVWAMDDDGSGRFRLVEAEMQLLPPAMRELRDMHVDGGEFTLGIPSARAFALVRLPQGRAVPMPPTLARVAVAPQFDQRTYVELLTQVGEAIQASHVARAR